ncbi:hypothetical protein FS842_000316 [Serendipita sp. 407]|nr:hypothetical protein FS842_000316 [Serendipita sp. 407]
MVGTLSPAPTTVQLEYGSQKVELRWVRSVAYSPNGQHVSGSCDDTIWTWDVETGEPVGEPLKGHTDPICRIAYSPDGRHIASGSSDKIIRIWDVTTGTPTVDNRIQVLNTETPGDSFTLDLRPDKSGWVRHPNGGLLVWIPEQCRNGLTCAAILTIPTDGFDRAVRLDLGDACLGASWEQIKAL